MKKTECIAGKYLRAVGIPEHLAGFSYLLEAVELSARDPMLPRRMMKQLYPAVAEKFHSTPVRTERAMRHAIETAWSRGNPEVLAALFGNSVSPARGKPANREFIARISSAVRQEE